MLKSLKSYLWGDLLIYVLYHAHCFDGFGAAYSAWKRLGESANYVPCMYSQKDQPLSDVPSGSEVYVVDFCFSRDALLAAAKRLKSLVVLDHHLTAKEHLEGTSPTVFSILDMNKSGAMLSWEHFFPGVEAPALIQHIQDRDLWRFLLPGTKEIHQALLSYPKDFAVWDGLVTEKLREDGSKLLALQAIQVDSICDRAGFAKVGPEVVPVANATQHYSEVCYQLLSSHPTYPFAAYFFDSVLADGSWVRNWGLRGRGDYDVSVVAKSFGGGGHKSAAGFSQPLPSPEP